MKRVVVLDYDPSWPEVFEKLRLRVSGALSDIATVIEHVGSTSVPGLAAKPVIDMDVVVDPQEVPVGIAKLSELGYKHRGDLGISGREAFRPPVGSPKHHLYLCPSDSPALANHLAIRDYLRTNPSAVKTYGQLKIRLAQEFPQDIDGYVEAKTDFLIRVLRRVGLPEDALAEIEQMNAKPK